MPRKYDKYTKVWVRKTTRDKIKELIKNMGLDINLIGIDRVIDTFMDLINEYNEFAELFYEKLLGKVKEETEYDISKAR